MSAPVEFRHYLRRLTLADVAAGLSPVRTPDGLFTPPTLQWRYRERVTVNGAASYSWSEWQDVPFVREETTVKTDP